MMRLKRIYLALAVGLALASCKAKKIKSTVKTNPCVSKILNKSDLKVLAEFPLRRWKKNGPSETRVEW